MAEATVARRTNIFLLGRDVSFILATFPSSPIPSNMSEPIALFGLTVKPGDVHRMDVLRDFRITNVSLGEHVKGNARVVVKVHLIPQSGHPITEEEELLEGLMDEDDDDDEEDDEEDEEKEAARAMKQYPERTFVLCTLTPGKIEQVSVNIGFSEAEEIGFSVTGENEVDLLGNYLAPAGDFDQEPYDSDDDSEIDSDEAGSFDSDDEDDDEYDSDDMAADGLDGILAEGDSEDDEEDDSDRFENLGDVPSVSAAEKAAAAVPSKKRKALAEPAEADVSMASSVGAVSDAELAKAAAAEGLDVSKLSKAQRKRLNKKLKLASGDADASVASTSSKPEAASTVKAETVKAAVAQNGKAAKTAEKQTVTKDGQQVSVC